MGYTKQNWENLPSTNTPITAERLNHMEDGIEEAWEHGGGGGGGIDIGTIVPFSGAIAQIPNGFMLCDGSAISRTTYATLFSIIGTTYGEGDGSTTFNLPNLQGRTLVGVDSEDTDFDVLGETGGSKYLQKHKHAVDYSLSVGNAEGRVTLGTGSGGSATGQYGYAVNDNIDVTTGNSGNLQPYITINYIIKVLYSQSGDIRSESLPVGTELDFDGDSQDIPTGWEQVDDVPVYSTTETKCGTWIDGKPLYRKVIECGALPNSTSKNVAHNISNLKRVINISGYSMRPGSQYNTWLSPNNPSYNTLASNVYVTDVDIVLNTYTDRSAFTETYVILEYTKTTD